MSDLPTFAGHVVSEPVRDQFDFWVGEWIVTSTAGTELAGHNSVRWVLDGAVLQEDLAADLGGQHRCLPRLRRRLARRSHGAPTRNR